MQIIHSAFGDVKINDNVNMWNVKTTAKHKFMIVQNRALYMYIYFEVCSIAVYQSIPVSQAVELLITLLIAKVLALTI